MCQHILDSEELVLSGWEFVLCNMLDLSTNKFLKVVLIAPSCVQAGNFNRTASTFNFHILTPPPLPWRRPNLFSSWMVLGCSEYSSSVCVCVVTLKTSEAEWVRAEMYTQDSFETDSLKPLPCYCWDVGMVACSLNNTVICIWLVWYCSHGYIHKTFCLCRRWLMYM